MAPSRAKLGAKCWSSWRRWRAAYASSRRGRAPPGSQSSRQRSAELLRRRCQHAQALDHPRVIAILAAHRNIDAVVPIAPGLHLIWVPAGRGTVRARDGKLGSRRERESILILFVHVALSTFTTRTNLTHGSSACG